MNKIFFCYPKCSTCQKAKEWLNENNIEYNERNIKDNNPTVDEIKYLYNLSKLPLKKFFNTSGMLYREKGLSKKLPDMKEKEQIELLASDGMLVKRPIFVNDDRVFIGFKSDNWEEIKK
jgi:arsenate reductase